MNGSIARRTVMEGIVEMTFSTYLLQRRLQSAAITETATRGQPLWIEDLAKA